MTETHFPSYEEAQFDAEMDYRRIYDDWISSLPLEERQRIEDIDPSLLSAQIDSQGEGNPELDLDRVADDKPIPGDEEREPEEGSPLQSTLRLMVGELLELDDPRRTLDLLCIATGMSGWRGEAGVERFRSLHPSDNMVLAEVEGLRKRIELKPGGERGLRRILGELVASDKIKLTVECLSLATGICYQGISQTELGKRYRMTRAAVSKRCREIIHNLGIPPSRAMRSEKACKTYSEAQHEHHMSVSGDTH